MSNVINLAERRIARAQARHTIGTTAALLTRDEDRGMRAHLMQEAFAEQELAGDGLSFERARATVEQWMVACGFPRNKL